MKLIIAGGRSYQFTAEDIARLDHLHKVQPVSEVVSGGARGADKCGERWAVDNGIRVKRFPAAWSLHGRAAGPIRNSQMARYADAAALFPGGKGTKNMHDLAVENGLVVFDFRETD